MSQNEQKKIVITIIGRDQVGIVAKSATVLMECNVNIEDINQKILDGEIFAMTMLADRANSEMSLPELTERLSDTLSDMGLDVRVQDAEVFRFMHRV